MKALLWVIAAIFAVGIYGILTGQVVCNSATVVSVGGCDKHGWCGTLIRDVEGYTRRSHDMYPVSGSKTFLCKAKP